MTIVATSIPVLHVFFKQAVNSAIETYQKSSARSKTRTNLDSAAGTLAHVSLTRSSNQATTISESFSRESAVDVLRRGSQNYVKLDDLMVDEKTGRVTAATSESKSDVTKPDASLYESS
jgi:hypothetical protein